MTMLDRQLLDWERESDRAWEELYSEYECEVDYDWSADDLAELVMSLAASYNFSEKDVWDSLEEELNTTPLRLKQRKYFDLEAQADKLRLYEHYQPWRILKSATHRWWYHRQLFDAGNMTEYLRRTHDSMRSTIKDMKRAKPTTLLEYTPIGRWCVGIGSSTHTGYYIDTNDLPRLLVHFGYPRLDRRDGRIDIRLYDSKLLELRAAHQAGATIVNVGNRFPRLERCPVYLPAILETLNG